MFKLIGRLIKLVIALPLALVALLLYPILWVLQLPLKLVGSGLSGSLGMLRGMLALPGRAVKGKSKAGDSGSDAEDAG